MPPKKYYSHEEIKELLSPYADRGWIRRFDAVKNKGQKFWLYVVRDFNIQHPKIEYLVDDIVRALEIKSERKSLVRAEMNKLESEGKLHIDTPEEEERWEKLLQEEREKNNEWEEMDERARAEQRELDEAFLLEKAKKGDEIVPISNVNQDPAKNPELLHTNREAKEKLDNAMTVTETEIEGEGTIENGEVVMSEIRELPKDLPKTEHAKELSELEKQQQAFVPKPPPEKAPEIKAPVIKEVESDGKVVYNKYEPKEQPKITTLGLPDDAVKRLKDIGVTTVADFEKMDKGQAKQILGQALYAKHEKTLKT
uniref:Uncharacterized protein n=1 Tax=viral metagenome TaxID=1070528 RepID=A0A6H1ZPT6_9ZZZZ